MKPSEALRIASINLFVLLGFLLIPAILYRALTVVRNSFAHKIGITIDKRAYYPTYKDTKKSAELLNEFRRLSTHYRDFIIWRRDNASYRQAKVSGKYNTRNSLNDSLLNSSWFFGGSTMWGTGASDNKTIPSIYSQITREHVTNFGETGWNSRQSLNYLINVVGDGYRPKRVLFYDGVNDVSTQCRSEILRIPSTSHEKQIQEALNSKGIIHNFKSSLSSFLLAPLKRFIPVKKIVQNSRKPYDCHSSPVKARKVADHLVNNWYTAYKITIANGGQFFAILQPTLFSSRTPADYLPKEEYELKSEYEAVYPLVRTALKKICVNDADFCKSYIDGSSWINTDKPIFIDFCHLSPDGNKIIATRIASYLYK